MSRRVALFTAKIAPQQLAILLIGAVALLWTIIEGIGALMPDHPSPYQVVWMRYAVHLLTLVIFFGPRYRSRLWRTRRLLPQLGRGLLMLGMPVCFILSVRRWPVENTWAIFWLAPLLALAVAALLLHEKTGWPVWLATAAAYAGALVIMQPQSEWHLAGAALALGMTLCFVFYLFSSRLLHDEALLPSLFYTAVAVLAPLSLRLPHFWQPLSWVGGLEMALIGLLGLLLLFCLDTALELANLSVVSPFLFITPLLGGGLDNLFAYRADLPSLILGGVIIVSTLLSLLVYDKRKNKFAAIAAPIGQSNAAPPGQNNRIVF